MAPGLRWRGRGQGGNDRPRRAGRPRPPAPPPAARLPPAWPRRTTQPAGPRLQYPRPSRFSGHAGGQAGSADTPRPNVAAAPLSLSPRLARLPGAVARCAAAAAAPPTPPPVATGQPSPPPATLPTSRLLPPHALLSPPPATPAITASTRSAWPRRVACPASPRPSWCDKPRGAAPHLCARGREGPPPPRRFPHSPPPLPHPPLRPAISAATQIHCRWAMLGAAGVIAVEALGFGDWVSAQTAVPQTYCARRAPCVLRCCALARTLQRLTPPPRQSAWLCRGRARTKTRSAPCLRSRSPSPRLPASPTRTRRSGCTRAGRSTRWRVGD